MGWIYFLLLLPLNTILPSSWGDENSVIENIQMICLIASGIMCYRYRDVKLTQWNGNQKALCYAGSLYFFLLSMREISWGRALILHADGSTYQYSEMGLYGQLVHPLVCVLLVLIVYLLYRAKLWNILRILQIPYKSFTLLLLFILVSWIGEKGSIDIYHGELAEELAELGVYFMMYYLIRDSLEKLRIKD